MTYVRCNGTLPPTYLSHDHLNKQVEVAVDEAVIRQWREAFSALAKEERDKGVELVWIIVDGFVLYWDPVSRSIYCSDTRPSSKI
jgi:nicotinamide/nicotinate riboside kinase